MICQHRNISRQHRWLLLITLLTGLLAWPAQIHAQRDLGDPVDLETFLDGVMAAHLESYHIPGAALVLVQNGEVLLAKGYGYADLEQRAETDPSSTFFRPGSVSKLFTWTAVMQLVEQGQLDLHADVNTYLDFTIPAIFAEPVTLAHLMTHTPGFEDKSEALFVLDPAQMVTLGDYLKEHQPRRVYPPGEVGAYSNYGTALAGYIVERISGQPFAEYVEEHILAPLGMTQSTFRQPLPPELDGQLAGGYGFHNGNYVRGDFEFVNPYPAGSMSMTAADMAPFMIAYLQAGRYGDVTILQPDTVAEMHTRHYAADPRLRGMTYGFMEQEMNNRRILHHGGDTFLFHAGLYLIPEEGVGLFVAYNAAGGSRARDELLRAFMDRYYPLPLPDNLTPPDGAAQRLDPLIGEYHQARSDYSTAAKILRMLESTQVSASPEGYLLVTQFGQIQPYVEIEPGLYRHQLRDDLVSFQTDANNTTWLLFDGGAPFAHFKPPWYATMPMTMLLLGLTVILSIGAMTGWLIGALSSWRRERQKTALVVVARWVSAVFGLLLLVFLIGFVNVFSDIAPAYGVPWVFFGDTPGLNVLMWLPLVMLVAAGLMALFTLIAWITFFTRPRSDWGFIGRFHYTLLTALAVAVMAALWYWNMLVFPA